MHKIFIAWLFSLGAVTTVFGVDSENAKKEVEVKERLKEISAAVQQHNTDVLISYWTKDAQWINPVTGETLKSNTEIADSLQKRTQDIEKKQFHLKVIPENITFPTQDRAIVEAIVEVKDSKENLIQLFMRKITLVNQDGKWFVKQVREVDITPPPPILSHLNS